MNSYTKPKCSTRSTPTKKIRRAPCNIGFITRDGKIRKSLYNFLPIVRIENFLFSFTALLYSTALKHQPPHFDTRAFHRLLFYLLFFLLHTSFSSTASTVLIDPNLLISPRWSRHTFAAIIVQYTPFPQYHTILHDIITIVSVGSDILQDRFSISTSH